MAMVYAKHGSARRVERGTKFPAKRFREEIVDDPKFQALVAHYKNPTGTPEPVEAPAVDVSGPAGLIGVHLLDRAVHGDVISHVARLTPTDAIKDYLGK